MSPANVAFFDYSRKNADLLLTSCYTPAKFCILRTYKQTKRICLDLSISNFQDTGIYRVLLLQVFKQTKKVCGHLLGYKVFFLLLTVVGT